jgi:hypothetical protein
MHPEIKFVKALRRYFESRVRHEPDQGALEEARNIHPIGGIELETTFAEWLASPAGRQCVEANKKRFS